MKTLDQVSTFLWRHSERIRWTAVILLLSAAGWSFAAGDVSPQSKLATVAAVDIASGATLRGEDVTIKADSLGLDTVPAAQVPGEISRGPIQAGEPITTSRLTPGRAVELPPGMLAFPLPIPEGDIASLLHSGDRIDVLAATSGSNNGTATVVAADIEVLAIPQPADNLLAGPRSAGAIVLISTTESQAIALAGLGQGQSVSIAIR